AQRASAGLIITEATQVSPQGVGYPKTPGIHTEEQVAGWRLVTDAVHAANGLIFLQLWHVGRISHPYYQPGARFPSRRRPSSRAARSTPPKDPSRSSLPGPSTPARFRGSSRSFARARGGR